MSPDEARERFSQALEDELPEGEREAFAAALARDPNLAHEYEQFTSTVRGTRALGSEPPPPVNLVPGVQRKLRERSRGRYYRDRFSSRPPHQAWVPLVIAVGTLVALVGAWFLYGWLLP
jgi:anti-sigma factor RsiW